MRLIDADELIEAIKNELWDWETVDGITATTVLKQTISDIGNQPTAEAEPIRHGHWVNDFGSPLKCSSCGIAGKANEITLRSDFKFCPYCGAKMDEVNDDR